MWNFSEKVCSDERYRQRSLDETADWKRVADLYEPLARRLYQELSRSERSETDWSMSIRRPSGS